MFVFLQVPRPQVAVMAAAAEEDAVASASSRNEFKVPWGSPFREGSPRRSPIEFHVFSELFELGRIPMPSRIDLHPVWIFKLNRPILAFSLLSSIKLRFPGTGLQHAAPNLLLKLIKPSLSLGWFWFAKQGTILWNALEPLGNPAVGDLWGVNIKSPRRPQVEAWDVTASRENQKTETLEESSLFFRARTELRDFQTSA